MDVGVTWNVGMHGAAPMRKIKRRKKVKRYWGF